MPTRPRGPYRGRGFEPAKRKKLKKRLGAVSSRDSTHTSRAQSKAAWAALRICVEAKSPVPAHGAQPRGRSVLGRAGSTTGSSPGDPPSGQSCSPLVGRVTGWQDGSGIGTGLARSGPQGTVMRQPPDAQVPSRLDGSPQMCSMKLSELIVRFMRLSALVAMDLGWEATEEHTGIEPLEVLLGVGLGINPAFARRSSNRGQARENVQGGAAEGSAQQGPEAEEENEEEDEFKQFDPDDLPELQEATRVLFPSLSRLEVKRLGKT
ncbi:predicted protein [Postia placenta Mad-698-R]|nr:predicted protein [Postia placenta Mad-698-R]